MGFFSRKPKMKTQTLTANPFSASEMGDLMRAFNRPETNDETALAILKKNLPFSNARQDEETARQVLHDIKTIVSQSVNRITIIFGLTSDMKNWMPDARRVAEEVSDDILSKLTNTEIRIAPSCNWGDPAKEPLTPVYSSNYSEIKKKIARVDVREYYKCAHHPNLENHDLEIILSEILKQRFPDRALVYFGSAPISEVPNESVYQYTALELAEDYRKQGTPIHTCLVSGNERLSRAEEMHRRYAAEHLSELADISGGQFRDLYGGFDKGDIVNPIVDSVLRVTGEDSRVRELLNQVTKQIK